MKPPAYELRREFDQALWEAGVESEAFWPEREPDTVHYTLRADGKKVGLASVTPFSGERVEVAYHVDPAHRGRGHGKELIRRVLELHPKAIFTVKRQNAASQGALAGALKGREFGVTSGRHVLRVQTDGLQKSAFWRGFWEEIRWPSGR